MMNDKHMKKNQNPSAGRTNSTAKHLFLACGEATLRDAQVAFRELQHGEGRGTTETDYAKLERAWEVNEMYR
jgi:hypothetical protein|tara:strand:+ start:2118 stop:2333 length:216 start_codon:yes stop_codon:yes gene_type:complete